MRTIMVLAVIAVASVALGGCFFHHNQQAYVTELPPTTPLK
ncbi:MAG: hypothetical protein ACM3MH_09685 [Actinomycetota bacterium]|jgi:hypothetical protein